MRAPALLFALAALLSVAGFGWLAASYGVKRLEQDTKSQLKQALVAADQGWTEIEPDGLVVGLSGTAPDENARFRVLEIAGQLVDSRRLKDDIAVKSTQEIVTPEFSLQILRNDLEISLIGLIPLDHGRNVILPDLRRLGDELKLTDMLETADYDVPQNWKTNVAFALYAAQKLPRTHINVTPETISVSGVTESVKTRSSLSRDLNNRKPKDVVLDLDLSAPLPVVNPFRFTAKLVNKRLAVSACSADNDVALIGIVNGLRQTGQVGDEVCNLALGAPSNNWAEVVNVGLSALRDMKGGEIDITDLEVRITAPKGTDPETFESMEKRLQGSLPEAYHLTTVLPEDENTGQVVDNTPPPAFKANLTEDGFAILAGSVRDAPQRLAVANFAASLFGSTNIADEMTLRKDLPEGWTALVLKGLEGTAKLRTGEMELSPSDLVISGRSDYESAGQELSEQLAALSTDTFTVVTDVSFDETLVEIIGGLVPETCAEELDAILQDTQITFEPSSDDIAEPALIVIESIADILKSCPTAVFEIGGHTDSQGSEGSNQRLSQGRAEAVLDALLSREVVVRAFTTVGYGESQPIADNETEDGREENRRIEFRLLNGDKSTETSEASE